MRIARKGTGEGGEVGGGGDGPAPGKRTHSQGLPPALRSRAEASTGADLSTVRVHDDAAAHASAAGLGALAYATGHDIWFGAGQYQPGTPAGDRLIAHEVAHTVQQGPAAGAPQAKLEVSAPGDAAEVEADRAVDAILAGAPATITRGGGASIARADWGSAYGSQDPKTAVDDGTGKSTQSASTYEQSINQPGGPVLKPASDPANTHGAAVTKSKFRLTKDELIQILQAAQGKQALDYMLSQGGGKDGAANRAHAEEELAKYVTYCQQAFDTMMIDTIEAQALFLAHAAGETAFTKLTEGQTNRTNFESDPSKVEVSTSTAATTGQKYGDGVPIMDGPMRYGQAENGHRAGVDPNGAINGADENSFDQTFIGRGPIQVTFRTSYVQTLMFMQKRAEDLRAQAAATQDAAEKAALEQKAGELEAAVTAIKAEPRNAADPKYAFLFSAAYMQMSPMVRNSAGGFTNAGMTGGAKDPQGAKKQRAYAKAVELLQKHKAEDDKAATQTPAEQKAAS
ncbi:MAG TPA: DUF4157 domain-containing protein [Kofleriaceae bacterium]|nr:DUF4157 domain-containing protein [Kofleriaceae bacterium]